jgi:hypothetical protein
MPKLNFTITGDDRPYQKTLANVRKASKQTADYVQKDLEKLQKGLDKAQSGDDKKRKQAVKAAQDQSKATDSVVAAADRETAAHERTTAAIKKKASAFDAVTGKQIKPVQMSSTLDEVAKYNEGRNGTIKGGTVVGPAAFDYNALAIAATEYSTTARAAHNSVSTTVQTTEQKIESARRAINSLKIDLQAYKNIAAFTTDVKVLGEYNNRIDETKAEIARLGNVGKAGYDDLGNRITATMGKQELLTRKIQMFKDALGRAKAPQSFVDLNRKIEETENQLGKLKNAGRTGFDELGNAIKTNTKATGGFINGLSGIWSWISKIAYIVPGLGIGGLIALMIEPLSRAIDSLGVFKSSLEKLSAPQKAINASYQEAATLIASETAATTVQVNKINDKNASMITRQGLLNEFINKNPSVLSALTLQNIATQKGTDIINDYVGALKRKIEMQQLEAGYSEALQKSADIKSGKDDTGIGFLGKALILGNKVATGFRGESMSEAIDKANARFKAKAEIDQDAVVKGYEDRIKATAEGEAKLKKIEDTSLTSLEARLASTNSRLRNLQAGESAKTLQAEKASLEKQIKQRESLLGIAPKAKVRSAPLRQQNNLQAEIDSLHANALKKQKTQDEQEIEAVQIKYDAIRKKIKDFYADPLNKGKKLKVDASTIDKDQETETANVIAGQQLAKDKQAIEAQKVLFDEYEQYKLKVGEKIANERFASDLKGFTDYVAYLKSLSPKDSDASAYANRMRDYLRVALPKAQNEQVKVQEKMFSQILADTQTYQQQRAILISNSQKTEADLRARGYAEQADQELLNRSESLKQFDNTIIHQLQQYRFLFDGFRDMSATAIKEYIANARQKAEVDLQTGAITKEAYDATIKAAKEAAAVLDSRLPNSLREASNIFKDLANSTDGLSDGLTNVLNILADMTDAAADVVSGITEMNKGIQDYQKNKEEVGGGLLGSISAGLAIAGPAGKAIGAVVNVVKGVTNFFKAARESAKQAAAELNTYYDNIFKGELAYNQLLRERERTLKNISDLSIRDLKTQQALLNTQKGQASSDYYKLLTRIQSTGQQVTGTHIEKKGGFLGIGRKSYTVQDTAGVAGLGYDQIEKLYTEGKLTDSTKAWFEELKKAKQEMEAIGQSAQDVLDQINQIATGTTADSISDAIVKGFKEGKRSAADFANDFTGLMQDSWLSIFKSNYLDKAMGDFYTKFAEMSGDADGLTESDVIALRAEYAKSIQGGLDQLADFDKVIAAAGGSLDEGLNSSLQKGLTPVNYNEISDRPNKNLFNYLKNNKILCQ